MNPKVEQFLSKAKKWQNEMTLLREMIQECNLTEDFKWMHPCYTLDNANIVLIHGFKDYCALLFFKGVLMKDEKGILIQQTENVQDRRQLRFKNVEEIEKLESVIKDYINEAIAIEKAGLKVVMKTTAEFNMPEEFKTVLDDMPELNKAFYALLREDKKPICCISPRPNKPKPAKPELKNTWIKSWTEKVWMIKPLKLCHY